MVLFYNYISCIDMYLVNQASEKKLPEADQSRANTFNSNLVTMPPAWVRGKFDFIMIHFHYANPVPH